MHLLNVLSFDRIVVAVGMLCFSCLPMSDGRQHPFLVFLTWMEMCPVDIERLSSAARALHSRLSPLAFLFLCFQANTRLRSASGYVLLEAGLPFLYTLDFLLDSQSITLSLSFPLQNNIHCFVISSISQVI